MKFGFIVFLGYYYDVMGLFIGRESLLVFGFGFKQSTQEMQYFRILVREFHL